MASENLTKIRVADLPPASDSEAISRGWESWAERLPGLAEGGPIEALQRVQEQEASRRVLEVLFCHSPFLTRCALAEPAFLASLLSDGPAAAEQQVWPIASAAEEQAIALDRQRTMEVLRVARRRQALLVAVCDIAGLWSLEQVTGALSNFADRALDSAIGALFLQLAKRGDLVLPNPDQPCQDSGYVILGMGKLGAGELNYSSDIDLIALFDPQRITYRGKRSVQECFVRLTRDLVLLLEERTKDGYVFRTDLRLRPDPGAMPLAISYNAALTYYENFGQNWERAAMIKARPVAGDLALGQSFLGELRPFIWRKNLDFWAIQDVHSIKRQIHSHKGGGAITLAGHNIKLGRGGIREIEFFAQTQQLIYGGRLPALRSSRTRTALDALATAGKVDRTTADSLDQAYVYLRGLEHRLQMVEDQQTQTLPSDAAGLTAIASFMGHDRLESFRDELFQHLRQVELAYSALFEEAPSLSGPGNLVFTGGEPDEGTLTTLQSMGFEDGEKVFHLVRAWHHGRFRATRSTRARQILTELMPDLLAALGQTASPDTAVAKFDEFLSGLPSGVQLFSLIHANPWLLDLLAEIMGTAPALADRLSRKPGLLDAVLSFDFFSAPPDLPTLSQELADSLQQARAFEEVLDLSRRWVNDRRFQVGVQILQRMLSVEQSSHALSHIAESALVEIYPKVREEVAQRHGIVEGGQLAILALGKLGSEEMTVTSDLDLILLYDVADSQQASDGDKPLAASQYYSRLAQRFINALTAPTAEGQLYEVDMRLRPSGNAGPIATSLRAFEQYQDESAWTWERMALTRARVLYSDGDLGAKIMAKIHEVLTTQRDLDQLLVNIADMRARIAGEFEARSLWDVKHLRGGLVDLQFIGQFLQLRHAPEHPDILDKATSAALAKMAEAGLLGPSLAATLIDAQSLLLRVQNYLRLTANDVFDEETAPAHLKEALAQAAEQPNFTALKDRLLAHAQQVYDAYCTLIEAPAEAARARIATAAEAQPNDSL